MSSPTAPFAATAGITPTPSQPEIRGVEAQPVAKHPATAKPKVDAAKKPAINWSTINWHTIAYAEGINLLNELQRVHEHAAKVMQQRQVALSEVECYCKCGARFDPAKACMSKALRDPATQLPYNVYFATQNCVRRYNKAVLGMEDLPR